MLLLILQKFGKQMVKYIMKGDNFSHQKSSLLDMHVQLTKYLPGEWCQRSTSFLYQIHLFLDSWKNESIVVAL